MLAALTAMRDGDFTTRLDPKLEGIHGELAGVVNEIAERQQRLTEELARVGRMAGREGRLSERIAPGVGKGSWTAAADAVNTLLDDVVQPAMAAANVLDAAADGDLNPRMELQAGGRPLRGDQLRLARSLNRTMDQLASFTGEITRVAREVGTEGRLGGRVSVQNAPGAWKDVTEAVNTMTARLTAQVRDIATVTTAMAKGDLTRTVTVDAQGEMLELKSTVNRAVEQLSSFADEVTRVAREVGTEGKLGGQARVEGVSGTWRDLTENVNQLAGNLTTQVRAIAEVSTAVTQGDLTRSITVEAQGEVAELKDNINQMIQNLRETTRVNAEQDWLKTNLARISGMLQGQRDLQAVTQLIMSEVTPIVGSQHGAFFLVESDDAGEEQLRLIASYGYRPQPGVPDRFRRGEGLVGQCALEGRPIRLTDVPDDYIKIASGLGEATPATIQVMPIMFEEQVLGVIELGSLRPFGEVNQAFLDQLTDTIGVVINTIRANMRTEELLAQSQALTQELQKQSEELRQTNDELQDKAVLLSQQNRDIEIKNAEIELARRGLEEKAAQLALSSKYKSEFLANMSHELRTPLNSLLILSRMLAENPEGNLAAPQVEFAETIHAAGNDLLALINDILDLSKVEAGKMDLHVGRLALADLCDDVERAFRPLAEDKGLAFTVEREPGVPAVIVTDEQRLEQILRNLLSNAVKFTHDGDVTLRVGRADDDTLAFAVTDTGVGIPDDKLALIFEAFQQADGTTSRKYGGTGLGLSISREIARLLGGEIRVRSVPGEGSTFTLLLPLTPRGGDGRPEAGLEPETAVAEHAPVAAPDEALAAMDAEDDDRGAIAAGDRVLLVIAHDAARARAAVEAAHERGFKALVARRAPMGLVLAREHQPAAVLVFAGDGRGEVLLGQLKQHPETRHRPVFVVGPPTGRLSALRAGAAAYLGVEDGAEAVGLALAALDALEQRAVKRLALIRNGRELDPATRALLGAGDDVDVVDVPEEEALQALRATGADCAVVPVGDQAERVFGLLEQAAGDDRLRDLPVIVYTPEPLAPADRRRLDELVTRVNAKAVSSPERLVDETALALHRMEANLPAATRKLLSQVRTADSVFHGKRILIVDDDIRNVFALTSALEMRGMKVLYAENGREGLAKLRENQDVELVLLDVMMPEMDGYETARSIRAMSRFEHLPIISLTAKAMKGDREKCIAAGASDYITKPVDMDELLSLMRVWLQ